MSNVLSILRPDVVRGWWSEVVTPYQVFQDYFKTGPGQATCEPSDTRQVSLDIVDDNREVASFRAPSAPAAVVAPQIIGTRPYHAPRTFEKIGLSYELLSNIREIGKGASHLDTKGMTYVKHQMAYLRRRGRRWRENLMWGMMRGTLKYNVTNTEWTALSPDAVSSTHTIDWKFPADHLGQAGGIIDASWDLTATPIITHMHKLSAKLVEDCGYPLRHAWINHQRLAKILNNTEVRNLGGTANVAYKSYSFTDKSHDDKEGAGIPETENVTEVVLKGLPQVTWHATDHVCRIDDGTGTLVNRKYVGDDEMFCHPSPSYDWYKMWEILEYTNQVYGQDPKAVYGFDTWIKHPVDHDVPEYWLYMLDNAIPAVNPNAMMSLDVTP